jgi:hypothetical protein
MRWHSSVVNALLVLVAFGWLLLFAHNGLMAPFSGDDLMNLHGYLSRAPVSLMVDNLRYWSTSYRPLGGLCYVALYKWFGFDPLPFRVLCFGLLALNLGLLWRFILRLSASREVAFLALLIAASPAWFIDLYYSPGTMHDLLCYSFYLGAFNLYLGVRARGDALTWRHLGIVAALYVCALNAKEMAVSLPVLLAAYETIYHGRGLPRSGRGVVVTGLLSLPYVAGKLMGAGSLVENPAYRLTISPGRYLDTFHLYLNPLLYQHHVFRDPNTVQLLGMLAFALYSRSRPLLPGAGCWSACCPWPFAHYRAFFCISRWPAGHYTRPCCWSRSKTLADPLLRLSAAGDVQAEHLRIGSIVALPVRRGGPRPCHRRSSEDASHLRKCPAAFAPPCRRNDRAEAPPAPRRARAVRKRSVRQGRLLPALPYPSSLPRHDDHMR